MTFSFNSKETYLAFKADWKQRFLKHLDSVRAAKIAIRTANREYSKGGSMTLIWDAYRSLKVLHKETSTLLSERWAASSEAAVQTYMRQAREKAAG